MLRSQAGTDNRQAPNDDLATEMRKQNHISSPKGDRHPIPGYWDVSKTTLQISHGLLKFLTSYIPFNKD